MMNTSEREFLKMVGGNIRRLRKARRVTLADIRKAGITTAYHASRIERGLSGAKVLTLKMIADLIGCQVKDLFNGEENTKRNCKDI